MAQLTQEYMHMDANGHLVYGEVAFSTASNDVKSITHSFATGELPGYRLRCQYCGRTYIAETYCQGCGAPL